ncbi:MAG: tripartite tricarboxylate transporter TctB family protein [Pseudomonadota bacterium]
MRPDRYVALGILAFSIGYGYLAWNFPLLPFERHQAFRPNVMPIGLAAFGIFFSLAVLFRPGGDETGLSGDAAGWRFFSWRPFCAILALMVIYIVLLRPAGFLLSTTLFLFGGGVVLGERRWILLSFIAFTAAIASWFLVDRALGIFLRPLPEFLL